MICLCQLFPSQMTGLSENGDAAKSATKDAVESAELCSKKKNQLSRCEDEDGETARSLAAYPMSSVHVSDQLGNRSRRKSFWELSLSLWICFVFLVYQHLHL